MYHLPTTLNAALSGTQWQRRYPSFCGCQQKRGASPNLFKQNSLHLLSIPHKKNRKRNNENEKTLAGKATKIRIYPTKEEQQKLQNWIRCSHWTYNERLRLIKEEKVPRITKVLRARVSNEEAINKMQKPWIGETPYDIHDAYLADLLKA
jgi:hypothetical protein